ncbi:unnamed protein product [Rotaria sp. Silwood1]|nr:unnamed protein product [Rotaria sp. Silwood1]
MNQSNIGLLDLPNEILLIIFKKLDNMDVLYSLLCVNNRRLDTIIQENDFASILNFVLTSSFNATFAPVDLRVDQFCTSILRKIHHKVKTLIVDLISLKSIVYAARYPNLTELKLFNHTTDLYACILKFFEDLKYLSIIGLYPHYYPSLVLSNVPSTTFFSSTLNKLCIRVRRFEDCLALLDGRLKQLTILIIVIENMEYASSNV